MMRFSFVLLAFLAVVEVAHAERPRLIPRDLLFDNPPRTQPTLSPDGRTLAFLAPSPAGVSNVWIEPLEGGEARMLTADDDRGIYAYRWAEDGQHLLYVQDRDGDENWHLYATRWEDGTTRDLTPFDGVQATDVRTHPRQPHSVVVGLNLRDPRFHDLHRIDLRTGDMELAAENPGDVAEWEVDDRLRVRAAVALDPETSDTILRVRDVDGPWRQLARWPFLETGSVLYRKLLGFTADGEALLVQYPIGSDKTRLVELSVADGSVRREIASDPRCDLWNLWWQPQVLLDERTREVQAVGFDYLKPEWRVVDPDFEEDFSRLRRAGEGTMAILSRDRAGAKWVVHFSSDRQPGRNFLYDRDTGELRWLFDDLPALAEYELAPSLPVMISARDGLQIPSQLFLPVGVPPRDLPMILLPHGGPWAQDHWGFDAWAQLLANRGYAVLLPNFRGSTGYGKAHLNAANREWAGKMLDDLTDAVQWAVEQGIADPERVGVFGGSYGGYASFCALTFTPEVYACGVIMVGPSNVRTLFESFPPYWTVRKKRWELRVGPVETDDAWNERISPLFHAENIRAPMLVGHGTHDPRVHQAESDRMVEAARRNQIDVTYVVYPDEGHGWARPENNKDWMGRVEEFLAAHLGGRKEPFEPVPGSSAELR